MKGFLVFCGQDCYSDGGAADLVGFAPSLDYAAELVEGTYPRDWAHALSLETMTVVSIPMLGEKGGDYKRYAPNAYLENDEQPTPEQEPSAMVALMERAVLMDSIPAASATKKREAL